MVVYGILLLGGFLVSLNLVASNHRLQTGHQKSFTVVQVALLIFSPFTLLLAYSIGFGLPFLLVGLFVAQASAIINKLGPALKYINIVFGIVLIILGILIFTQNLAKIANFELLNSLLLK